MSYESRICLTLPGPDCHANAMHIRECSFSALEFRLDLIIHDLSSFPSQISELLTQKPIMKILAPRRPGDFSIIMTLRRKEDGGNFSGPVAEGQEIFLRLLKELSSRESWPHVRELLVVDVEQQSEMPVLFSFLEKEKIRCIHSFHFFEKTLPDLADILDRSPGIPKIALMPSSLNELNTIIKIGQDFSFRFPDRPFILIPMGMYGTPCRIFPEKIGSWISFMSPGKSIAPGQLSSKSMENYRRKHLRIEKNIPLFAIIGNQVSHSQSPEYHNRFFASKTISAAYIPLHCDNIKSIREFAMLMNLQGASVTIPHKESIRLMLDGESEDCSIAASCNTVYQKPGGAWYGENSDIEGFLSPLQGFLQEHSGKKLRATIIGAGGAARAVAYALLKAGIKLLILNRTLDRARKLASHMEKYFPGEICYASLHSQSLPLIYKYNMLIVQSSSQGMDSTSDPLPFYSFTGSELVYDIIYSPSHTPILDRASQAGCTCINGWKMFLAQAEIQAKIFERCFTHN